MGIETKYYTNANEPKSLGLASAAVGQIPKIKAVDSNGVPTEWEAADMASGADGKSAYAYAVESGYAGTETEFAAKLAEEIPTVDDTLAQSGQAADASVVGNRLSALSEEIVTTSESKVAAHNTGTDTHSDIRLLIQGLTDRLNALADSDDTTLDQLSEVVAYIKSNRSLIEAITTSKVSVADIIDNLTTNVSNKPLSAAQGVALKALIDAISIPTTLPNPNTLTFTGAVTGSYDGSAAMTMNIPQVKSAYQYAQEGGYTGTETEFAKKIASGAMLVTITDNNDTLSADKSCIEIRDAILAGIPVLVLYYGTVLSLIGVTASALFFGTTQCENDGADAIISTTIIKITSNGEVNDVSVQVDSMPNPNAITFTGAVTSSYNGSEPVTINIPESGAGNMKKLTFTGAVTGEYDGTTDVNVNIPIATSSTAGAIKVGNGLSISADGTLSVTTAKIYTGTSNAPSADLGENGDIYIQTEG